MARISGEDRLVLEPPQARIVLDEGKSKMGTALEKNKDGAAVGQVDNAAQDMDLTDEETGG